MKQFSEDATQQAKGELYSCLQLPSDGSAHPVIADVSNDKSPLTVGILKFGNEYVYPTNPPANSPLYSPHGSQLQSIWAEPEIEWTRQSVEQLLLDKEQVLAMMYAKLLQNRADEVHLAKRTELLGRMLPCDFVRQQIKLIDGVGPQILSELPEERKIYGGPHFLVADLRKMLLDVEGLFDERVEDFLRLHGKIVDVDGRIRSNRQSSQELERRLEAA